jgi:hypothetical protein
VRDLCHRFGEHVLCNAAALQGFREPSRSLLIKLRGGARLRYYIGEQLLEVIFTSETDFKYLRVMTGASSLPVRSAFVRSFQVPPSVNVSARLKLHL